MNDSFEVILEGLKSDLSTMRVGRANPLMVENINVDAYGGKTPLKQLASINVPEARTLVIQPWDAGVIKEIEKSIIASEIGIAPVIDGKIIRLTVPQLTEESRTEITKQVNEKIEAARIKARRIRDGQRDEIGKQEKSGDISEDDKYEQFKSIDEEIKQFNDDVKALGEKKKQEVMTI